jgi:DNA-binding LacI/PurR family transcriptional regulator
LYWESKLINLQTFEINYSKDMKQKTILDIAAYLKISPSTVSRALNDHPDINPRTKILVNKVAKEIGYVPNPIARGLRNNTTTTIGVLVPEIKHDFFSSAISGIEEVAYQSGFTIILCQSNESYAREILNTNVLIQHRVAGMIVSISQSTKSGEHFNESIKRGVPLVFFDRACSSVEACKVIIDDEQSAFNATNHLIQKGYKKIAHFAGPELLEICVQRKAGYCRALRSAGMEIDDSLILIGGLHEQDGFNSMQNVLEQNKKIDAIFAVNDPVAIGAFQKIKEVGLKIPADIGIVGFSNNRIAGLVDPKLTTIEQPSFEMGKKAAEILLTLISGKQKLTKPFTEILETRLIVRGST